MRRLTLAGAIVTSLLVAATSTGYAASTGGYSPAVYPGSERIQSAKSMDSSAANASAHATSSSQGGLVRKCIPQACGTPWGFLTRNPYRAACLLANEGRCFWERERR